MDDPDLGGVKQTPPRSPYGLTEDVVGWRLFTAEPFSKNDRSRGKLPDDESASGESLNSPYRFKMLKLWDFSDFLKNCFFFAPHVIRFLVEISLFLDIPVQSVTPKAAPRENMPFCGK